MAKRRISLYFKGLYWTLALAVGLLALPDADAQAVEHALLTERELVTGAAIKLRDKIARLPHSELMLRQMANLAERSAIGAERALAIGDAALFDSDRTQFREQFGAIRSRLGGRAREGGGAAEYTLGVLALHGYFEPQDVDAACLRFTAALAKGYAGAKFRASQCLEKENPSRAAALLREAADSGHPAAASSSRSAWSPHSTSTSSC